MQNTIVHELEHQLVQANGISFHVVQAGPVDGPLALLLHGFPEAWFGWRYQINFLATLGYRVWAPDQRGYNLTEKPNGIEAYKLDNLSADAAALIRAAGRERAIVIAHDWGAAVAWHLATTQPQMIEKLIILNVPHPGVMTEFLRENPSQILRSGYIGFFQIPLIPEGLLLFGDSMILMNAVRAATRPGTFSDADAAMYTKAWSQPGAMTAMLNWYRAGPRYLPTYPDNLRITNPTLIIWGAQDVALDRELAQRSLEWCDDGRLIYIEEAGHFVQHEESERVNGYIAEFLGQQM